jgi:hypothetical protein
MSSTSRRQLLGLPFFDAAVGQRGAVAMAKMIEREIDARGQQAGVFAVVAKLEAGATI